MVMDLGRIAYQRRCRFFIDGPESVISWYRAPAAAKVFPTWHTFGGINWLTEPWEQVGTIGEQFGESPRWQQGATPPTARGQGFAGPLAWFQGGQPFDPTADYPRDPFGLLEACTGNVSAVGGEIEGAGASSLTPAGGGEVEGEHVGGALATGGEVEGEHVGGAGPATGGEREGGHVGAAAPATGGEREGGEAVPLVEARGGEVESGGEVDAAVGSEVEGGQAAGQVATGGEIEGLHVAGIAPATGGEIEGLHVAGTAPATGGEIEGSGVFGLVGGGEVESGGVYIGASVTGGELESGLAVGDRTGIITICGGSPVPSNLIIEVFGHGDCLGQDFTGPLVYNPAAHEWRNDAFLLGGVSSGAAMFCGVGPLWYLRFAQLSLISFTNVAGQPGSVPFAADFGVYPGPWVSCSDFFTIHVHE